eukprot:TRINITY_DN4257_c0_g1_i3.p1 TRINITY_DN4257_c0_g1~~TRINITY_DN4257_c0_g1_i3.p1  ORF type:complete len:110 (+),score=21.45 TRINITY_DN4257_c0_g1_i3:1278-1607(+)
MIQELNWPTLQQRRQRARLTMLFKLRQEQISMQVLSHKLIPPPMRQRRSNNQQFSQIMCRTTYRQAGFLPRTIKEWNTLPQDTVDAKTTDTFASRVTQWQKTNQSFFFK